MTKELRYRCAEGAGEKKLAQMKKNIRVLRTLILM